MRVRVTSAFKIGNPLESETIPVTSVEVVCPSRVGSCDPTKADNTRRLHTTLFIACTSPSIWMAQIMRQLNRKCKSNINPYKPINPTSPTTAVLNPRQDVELLGPAGLAGSAIDSNHGNFPT